MENKEKDFWNWFLGFIEGDGCFLIQITDKQINFRISITQKETKCLERIKRQLSTYGVDSSIIKNRLDIFSIKSNWIIINNLKELKWYSHKKRSFEKFRLAFILHYFSFPKCEILYKEIVKLKLETNKLNYNRHRLNKEQLFNKIKNYKVDSIPINSINDLRFSYNPYPEQDNIQKTIQDITKEEK